MAPTAFEAQNVAYTWDSGDLKMTFFCFASWALISVKKTTERSSFLKLSQALKKNGFERNKTLQFMDKSLIIRL